MTPHVTTHRLRFNDTDRLGHVNNAVFAVMLEQGRSEMLHGAGLPMDGPGAGPGDGREDGPRDQAVVIVRLELDFVAEMAWPGEVRIETEVARLGTRSFTLRQRLVSGRLVSGGALCGKAETVLVVMDRAGRCAVPIDPWRPALSHWLAAA